MSTQLDLSYVINITVLPTPAQLGTPIINTIAIFTKEVPLTSLGGGTYGLYTDPNAVATDWGINSSTYAMALSVFSQVPNPVETDGYLLVIPRTPAHDAVPLETTRAAVTRFGSTAFYYGALIDEEMGSNATEFAALASMLHGNGKMFGYCSSNVADLQPGSMLDLVRTATISRARMFYYGNALLNGAAVQQTQIFAAAYLGRGLSTDFSGSGTAITMHGKNLVGITPDTTIGDAQMAMAKAAGIDVYVNISGIFMVFCSSANTWWDTVYNTDWFSMNLQVAGFNYLIPVNFKIPQTTDGMNGLRDAYQTVCNTAITSGVAAPGKWTAAVPVGVSSALFLSNIQRVGYYIWFRPIGDQAPSDRAARKAPPIQVALKFAGAIHSSNVIVQLNP